MFEVINEAGHGKFSKEKILAAKRAGLKEVMLCRENRKHVSEIEVDYIKGLNFHYVETMQEVLTVALGLEFPDVRNGQQKRRGKKPEPAMRNGLRELLGRPPMTALRE
jgi:predicted ATP-dependent protease